MINYTKLNPEHQTSEFVYDEINDKGSPADCKDLIHYTELTTKRETSESLCNEINDEQRLSPIDKGFNKSYKTDC